MLVYDKLLRGWCRVGKVSGRGIVHAQSRKPCQIVVWEPRFSLTKDWATYPAIASLGEYEDTDNDGKTVSATRGHAITSGGPTL